MEPFRGSRPRVLLHVDERRRDIVVLTALKRLCEEAGCRVVLSTRRTTAMYLNQMTFEAIVVPSVEHIPYERLTSLSGRSKIYVLPTEGALFEEKTLLSKYAGGVDPDRWPRQLECTHRVLLWGDHSRRILRNTGRFRDEQLTVVGAPRMDFFMAEPSDEEKALWEPSSLALICDFVLMNSYMSRNIFEKIDLGQSGRGVYQAQSRWMEDRFWIESAWIRVWLAFLDECQRRKEPVRLRIHPRENPAAYDYIKRKYGGLVALDQQDVPFEAWLKRVGILAGFNSTTFFELVATSSPAICLEGLIGARLEEHIDHFLQNHYPIMDYIETPTSFEELFDLIKRMRRGSWKAETAYGPQAREILRDVCSFPRTESALVTIVRTLLNDAGDSTDSRGLHAHFMEVLARMQAKTLEWITFGLRREPVTSAWFPMEESHFERQHRAHLERYARAALFRENAGSSHPAPRTDQELCSLGGKEAP